MSPTVSVVMAVYNGQTYLAEAIESILHQTFVDFEFIIIDDGSNDGTPVILDHYHTLDDRIRLSRNESNLGLTASLNIGLKLACGRYIARQDADDVSLPKRLALQVQFLDDHPQVGLLGSWVDNINEAGHKIGCWHPPNSSALLHWSLLFSNSLAHTTVMMRQPLAKQGYRMDLRYAQDYGLWLCLSQITRLVNLPETLCLRRKHAHVIGELHHLQQEQTAERLTQQAVSQLLSQNIELNLITKLRQANRNEGVETISELRAISNLVIQMYYAYINQNQWLNRDERRQVLHNAGRRLEKFAWQSMKQWPLAANQILWQTFLFSGQLPASKLQLKKGVRKLLKAQ